MTGRPLLLKNGVDSMGLSEQASVGHLVFHCSKEAV